MLLKSPQSPPQSATLSPPTLKVVISPSEGGYFQDLVFTVFAIRILAVFFFLMCCMTDRRTRYKLTSHRAPIGAKNGSKKISLKSNDNEIFSLNIFYELFMFHIVLKIIACFD